MTDEDLHHELWAAAQHRQQYLDLAACYVHIPGAGQVLMWALLFEWVGMWPHQE